MGDIIKNFVNGPFLIILHFSFRIERVITMMVAKWKSSNSIILFTFISCKSFPFSFVCLSVWTPEFLFYSMGYDQLLSLVCSSLVSGNPFNLTPMSFVTGPLFFEYVLLAQDVPSPTPGISHFSKESRFLLEGHWI